jgi:hypothetical protein
MQNPGVLEAVIYQEDASHESINQLNKQIDKETTIQDRINKFLDLYQA